MAEQSGATTKLLLDKLNTENYDSWSFRMMMVLKHRGLWGIAHGDEELGENPSDAEKEAYVKRSDKALTLIGLHICDAMLPHVIYARRLLNHGAP